MARYHWPGITVSKRRVLKKRMRQLLTRWARDHKRDMGAHDRWMREATLQGVTF